MLPSRDFGQGVHERLLAGDPTAPSQAVIAYLEPLTRRMMQRYPEVNDETVVQDAVTDALLEFVRLPGRFDPAKSTLSSYLTMAARGDLLNSLARERRRRARQVPLDSVEERLLARNDLRRTVEGAGREDARELMDRVLEDVPDELDRELLALMLDGERKTTRFAQLLGIEDRARAEQRKIVKRHKDRLMKRLQRLGVRLREAKPD